MTVCTNGIINDKTWSEISNCLIASPISNNVELINFDELINKLISTGKNIHNYTFTFDCKLHSNMSNRAQFLNQYANAILKAIDDYSLQNNILIESQDTSFLRILQGKRNGLRLFIYPSSFENGIQIAKNMGLYGITIDNEIITKEQIEIAHNSGLFVTLWGLDTEKSNTDAIYKNPDFVQTDKPIHFLKIFDRYKK